MTIVPFIAIAGLGIALLLLWQRLAKLKRDQFIRNAPLPAGLLDRLAKRRPELDLKNRVLVARALRQFFLAYLHSGCRFVSMPSQVVDDLWHEFILYTRHYDEFCSKAFGRFLHHTPAVVLSADKKNNEGLRRVWWYACKEENIKPRNTTRLPLLFALDCKLGIADGFVYTPDCRRVNARRDSGSSSPYCAGDFGDSSVDGGTDGFDDGGSSDSGDGSGGCGGGCGGD
jgi:hypothetical protein